MNELNAIVKKFADSGWNLLEGVCTDWLMGKCSDTELYEVIKLADDECGNCGCEFDPLYKRALELLRIKNIERNNTMKYQIFSENEWVFPDSEITNAGGKAELYAARGSDVNFQLLTDTVLSGGEDFAFDVCGLDAEVIVYQLMPAYVSKNSGPKTHTTDDYESVKDFVIRKAPFDIYDVTKPTDSGKLDAGRAAFYVRINVAYDAVPGQYDGCIILNIAGEKSEIPVALKVYNTQVPKLEDSAFHMVNWIYYKKLAEQYGVELYSEEYRAILGKFFENQLDMRNDYLMIPAGEPIRDENGKVVDFDFTGAEFVGKMAIYYGFKYIMGGFVARFNRWDEPDQYLLWDREVGVSTIEGFRQLKIYFKKAWECVVKNGWQSKYMQCMVDEPQFPNSLSYRALAGICRQMMPGVKINDPVETCDIAGACDVWAVKQAVYEKHYENFRKLQDMGEEMWLYTCGFPAGKTMNRVMDLPLTVSRLPMWLCYKYDCPGFLHWGYHAYNPVGDIVDGKVDGTTPSGGNYPAGNAYIVYLGDGRPWYGVRAHSQRTGAQDYELFNILGQRDKAKAVELIEKVCRTFDDYDGSAKLFDEVRHELLEILG